MTDQIFTQPDGLPEHETDLSEVIRDLFLFADCEGTVLHAGDRAVKRLGDAPILGHPFWEVLQLEVQGLKNCLNAYPPGSAHEVSSNPDEASVLLRIMPLPQPLAPSGGFVLVLTDTEPLEQMHDEYRERIEDHMAAWDDSVTLFMALFEGSTDGFLLADDRLRVLAANPRAVEYFDEHGKIPLSRNCRDFIAPDSRDALKEGLEQARQAPWTGHIDALAHDGTIFPVRLTLRRVTLQKRHVYQLVFENLSLQSELRERTTEVESMNFTLKKVLHTVEEEKQELKEEVVQEVKERLLPAVERLAESSSPELRRGYKSVIQDQLAGLAVGAATGEEEASLLRLTLREMEICRLVRMGRKGREIAEQLDISFETLQTHRKNIRKKLNLKGRKVSLATFLANHLSVGESR